MSEVEALKSRRLIAKYINICHLFTKQGKIYDEDSTQDTKHLSEKPWFRNYDI